jgi:hypothetical protein
VLCVDFGANICDLGLEVCDGFHNVYESAHNFIESLEDEDIMFLLRLLGYLDGIGRVRESHSVDTIGMCMCDCDVVTSATSTMALNYR